MNFYDTKWAITLFGTALGAGILFLPLKAGVAGIYPFFIMMIIGAVMAYFSHLSVYRYCSGAKGDIKETSQVYFGAKAAYIITALYFCAFLPACMSYAIGAINTIINLYNQNELTNPSNRAIISFVLVAAMVYVMCLKEEFILRIYGILVLPLCALLFIFSLYLISYWNFDNLNYIPDYKEFFNSIFLALPFLAFTFQFVAAISTFKQEMEEKYESTHTQKAKKILFTTLLMLLFFITFFTFSSLMCIEPNELENIKAQNISVASYFSVKFQSKLLIYFASFIAIFALMTSFFGHFFAAREGLFELAKALKLKITDKNLKNITNFILFIAVFIVVWLNVGIVSIIENFVSPIIVVLLFILPVYGFYKVRILEKYKNKFIDIFLLSIGIITLLMSFCNIFLNLGVLSF